MVRGGWLRGITFLVLGTMRWGDQDAKHEKSKPARCAEMTEDERWRVANNGYSTPQRPGSTALLTHVHSHASRHGLHWLTKRLRSRPIGAAGARCPPSRITRTLQLLGAVYTHLATAYDVLLAWLRPSMNPALLARETHRYSSGFL